jgi:hypothetical protein
MWSFVLVSKLGIFIGIVFRKLHALGYPKPKSIFFFINFRVNSSLSMLCGGNKVQMIVCLLLGLALG